MSSSRPALHDAQEVLERVVRGSFSIAGPTFFAAATAQLVGLLKVDSVEIAELRLEPTRLLRSLAYAGQGASAASLGIDVDGAWLVDVLDRGYLVVARDAQGAYPAERWLADAQAECALGVALSGADSAPLGILAAVSRRPLEGSQIELELLELFATRASSEIERQRALSLLQERQHDLVEAQRLAHLGSWSWDWCTGMVRWSAETYRIFGVSPNAFNPSREAYLAMVHPEDREDVRCAIDRSRECSAPCEFEHRIVRPDGSERTLHCHAEPLRHQDGEVVGLRGTALDFTPIVQLREAAAHIVSEEFDTPPPAPVDEPFQELSGALQEIAHKLETRLREGEKLARITEEIGAGLVLEEVLEHVYSSFRELLPYDRLGLALIDHENDRVVARWAKTTATEARIGRGFWAALGGSSLKRLVESREPRIINDLPAYLTAHPESESTRRVVEEGMRASLTCPLVALGRPIGFLFFSSTRVGAYREAHVEFYRRIASQLSLLIDKSRLYEQLLELSEVKSRLLGTVAHDLKNPIAVVSTYSELLERGDLGELNSEQLSAVSDLRVAAQRMRGLVEELLDARAIESGRLALHRENVPIYLCIFEAIADHSLIATSKGIDIDIEDGPGEPIEDLPDVFADRRRVAQALGNLIANAIKYSRAGSPVRIGARRRDDLIEVSVTDRGIGIATADLPRLFEDFGQGTLPPTAGEQSSGLGLAIVRRIVEEHGGTVGIRSRLGVGSTFHFTLPIANQDGSEDEHVDLPAVRQRAESGLRNQS